MSETLSDRDDRLHWRLRDLSDHVAFPEPSDLATRVTGELVRSPSPRRRFLDNLYRPELGYGLAVVLAVAIGILTFSPAARNAVADFLGIRGISITRDEPPDVPLGAELDVPGERVGLDEARTRAGFDVTVPDELGDPHETYFGTYLEHGVVTLVYEPETDLPEARGTGVGALITELRADVDLELIGKGAGPETAIEPVTVNGGEGYWLTGEPHSVGYLDPNGDFLEETLRLAGNTLIWQQGDLSLRLEADVPLDEALAIARSMD